MNSAHDRVSRRRSVVSASLLLLFMMLLAALLPSTLVAQTAPPPEDTEEYVASDTDDMDGDNTADVIVAAPEGAPSSQPQPGEVQIISGEDGDLVVTIVGKKKEDLFGYSVWSRSDLDGDGFKDVIIGAPMEFTGRAYVIYGPFDQMASTTVSAADADAWYASPDAGVYSFGTLVGAVHDLDGDGALELRIAALTQLAGGFEAYETYIFSSATGSLLFSATGFVPFDPWLEVAGDINGDMLVDQQDIDLTTAQLGVVGDLSFLDGDFTLDGIVDAADLDVVVDNEGADPFQPFTSGGPTPPFPGPFPGPPPYIPCDVYETVPEGYYCDDCFGVPVIVPGNLRAWCHETCQAVCTISASGAGNPIVGEIVAIEASGLMMFTDWDIDSAGGSVNLLSSPDVNPILLECVEPGFVTVIANGELCGSGCSVEFEFLIGFFSGDADGDGTSDECEAHLGSDPLDPNDTGDPDGDADGDGVTNEQECDYGSNAYAVDSDDDGLPDGWEHQYGLNPADPIDSFIDSDGDQVINILEYAYRSHPLNPQSGAPAGLDADGDGYIDWLEEQYGTDAYNAASAPNPGELHIEPEDMAWGVVDGVIEHVVPFKTIPMCVDDWFKFHATGWASSWTVVRGQDLLEEVVPDSPNSCISAKWRIIGAGEIVIMSSTPWPGGPIIGFVHIDAQDNCEDPCEIEITTSGGGPLPQFACAGEEIILTASPDSQNDPSCECEGEYEWNLLTGIPGAAEFVGPATGSQVTLRIEKGTEINVSAKRGDCGGGVELAALDIDLDIDSDNTYRFNLPDLTQDEDDIEEDAGIKVLIINRNDDDGDSVPDYADSSNANERFVPLVLNVGQVQDTEGVELSFEYDAAPLSDVTQTQVDVPDIQSSYFRYGRGSGLLRIWTVDGSAARSESEFIDSGQVLDLEQFAGETTFYLEAVNGSPSASSITINLTMPDDTVCSDTVKVLPFDSLTGLNETEIAGFTILRDAVTLFGTPGRDIIIGTISNDLLVADAGDDIIVAGSGNDVIHPGAGNDVVFASKGHNVIGLEILTLAPPPADDDVVIDEEDAPFTTDQVLKAYRMMYGEDDPWLEIFLGDEVNGVVEAVEGDGWAFSEVDWDVRHNPLGYAIQLEFVLGSPFIAAAHMREELLDIATSSLGASGEFSAAMINEAFEKALSQEPFDEELENFQELRQAAVANAAEVTGILANFYASGITVVSEVADVFITVGELADGNAAASIGLLPFVPATLTRSGRVFLKWDGNATFEKITDLANKNHIAKGADSGIGFVIRRNMPWEEFTAVDGSVCLRLGTAQEVFEKYGSTAHANTVLAKAEELALTGEYEYITMNRAWRTAVADNPPITGLTTRPDILAIRRNGTVDAIEVASNGQQSTMNELLQRLSQEMLSLPQQYQGNVSVIPLNPP